MIEMHPYRRAQTVSAVLSVSKVRSARVGCGLALASVLAGLLTGCASGSAGNNPGSTSAPTGAKAATVTFQGVTVTDATNLAVEPGVVSTASAPAAHLLVKDLVVGTGAAATPTAMVTVQYLGVRYSDGKQFDASWDHGGATSFSLTQVVPGFTQGIGGADGVAAMKVGGRRVMIIPGSLGYGDRGTPDGSIPPNASLVFVVDLTKVS
jgi:peptidylprolyl isomerase